MQILSMHFPNMAEKILRRAAATSVDVPSLNALSSETGLSALRPRNGPYRQILALVDVFPEHAHHQRLVFMEQFIMKKKYDWLTLMDFNKPERTMKSIFQGVDQGHPLKSRLINESGRTSPKPVFEVAYFIGPYKLGQATGKSVTDAQFYARIDALKRFCLRREKMTTLTDLVSEPMPLLFIDRYLVGTVGHENKSVEQDLEQKASQ